MSSPSTSSPGMSSVPITSVSTPPAASEADLLLIPWFEDETSGAVTDLDAATSGEIGRALGSKEFTGKLFDVFMTPISAGTWRARRVALVGAGNPAEFDADTLRKIAAAGGLFARQHRTRSVGLVLRGGGDLPERAQAAAEGLTLSEYDTGTYKTGGSPPGEPPTWTIVSNTAPTETSGAVARGRVLGDCSNL